MYTVCLRRARQTFTSWTPCLHRYLYVMSLFHIHDIFTSCTPYFYFMYIYSFTSCTPCLNFAMSLFHVQHVVTPCLYFAMFLFHGHHVVTSCKPCLNSMYIVYFYHIRRTFTSWTPYLSLHDAHYIFTSCTPYLHAMHILKTWDVRHIFTPCWLHLYVVYASSLIA